MTTNDDKIYIDRVLEGDSQAFAMLVNRYKDLVFSLALRMLKHREEAEEVSQDTFIKIYKSLNKFKGDSKFSTWVYKVTYNTCLDRIKKLKRTQSTQQIDEFTEHQIKTLDSALDRIEAKERKEALRKCIERLPSEDSFLVTLFYFEELSLEEISEIVGLTPNNVKVKLHRSRKKLLRIVKEYIEPELIQHYEGTNG
ncbi:sigma-70 family RNA polymerase sigma factor [Winogradskyella sp. 3972H.M.0a.05]|uniref:RNA polymerase sigma factor n=1 Tax=Winogradskyella sp. 3972H.M.0a.05 TaxID=2950277 RepID=UPI00339798AB